MFWLVCVYRYTCMMFWLLYIHVWCFDYYTYIYDVLIAIHTCMMFWLLYIYVSYFDYYTYMYDVVIIIHTFMMFWLLYVHVWCLDNWYTCMLSGWLVGCLVVQACGACCCIPYCAVKYTKHLDTHETLRCIQTKTTYLKYTRNLDVYV